MPIRVEPEPRRCVLALPTAGERLLLPARDSDPHATRVLLLQHPHESGVAIGTAHMATVCLPNAELHLGVD